MSRMKFRAGRAEAVSGVSATAKILEGLGFDTASQGRRPVEEREDITEETRVRGVPSAWTWARAQMK
jgi:hypothetical protein